MVDFDYVLAFTGLSNGGGPGDMDKLFAIGGQVTPLEGSHSVAAMGARCPFQGSIVDPFLANQILPQLTMSCCAVDGANLLRVFHTWFEQVRHRPRTIVLRTKIDHRFEIDLLEACRLADMPVEPGYRVLDLELLLEKIGVDASNRAGFEDRVLGPRHLQDTNRFHPNNIGGDRVQLALEALRRGTVV